MAMEHGFLAVCEARRDEQALYLAGCPGTEQACAPWEQAVWPGAHLHAEEAPACGGAALACWDVTEAERHHPALAAPALRDAPWERADVSGRGAGAEGRREGAGEAAVSFRREGGAPHFLDVHEPAPLPQDPYWSLEHTTLFLDLSAEVRPHHVMNRCLRYFEEGCPGSALVHVASAKCSFKVRVSGEGGSFLAKVKLYRTEAEKCALELHRRSGDALAFHAVLPGLAGHLRGCLSPVVNDWALPPSAEDESCLHRALPANSDARSAAELDETNAAAHVLRPSPAAGSCTPGGRRCAPTELWQPPPGVLAWSG